MTTAADMWDFVAPRLTQAHGFAREVMHLHGLDPAAPLVDDGVTRSAGAIVQDLAAEAVVETAERRP